MRNYITVIMAYCFYTVLLPACSTVQPRTPSPIGLVPLHQYTLAPNQTVQDTSYRVIRSEAIFNTTFTAADGNERKPDFSGQTVVAILLPQSTGSGLMFEKGEIVGNTLHVYGLSCIPGTGTNCHTGPALAATVPTSGNVTKVQFFINGSSRATVDL